MDKKLFLDEYNKMIQNDDRVEIFYSVRDDHDL